MADGFQKTDVVVGEVEVRPARPDERRRWDALMAEHHYLCFPGLPAVRGPGAAPRRGVARALAGAGRVAVRGVQVRAARPLAALTPIGAVPPSAPDRQQHAVPDPAGGGGRAEPASRTLGRSLRRLSAGLEGAARPSAGARGDVRGPVAARVLRRLELLLANEQITEIVVENPAVLGESQYQLLVAALAPQGRMVTIANNDKRSRSGSPVDLRATITRMFQHLYGRDKGLALAQRALRLED